MASDDAPPNVYSSPRRSHGNVHSARVGALAGAEHIGVSVYELAPGEGMVFHYHLQREELLIVLGGELSLRTATGWTTVAEGGVVAFPRGEHGAHGYENRSERDVRLLMISEQNGPNVSVYPDASQIGIFDAAHPADRRFGALFDLADAVSDYGGGRAQLVPPAPPPRF